MIKMISFDLDGTLIDKTKYDDVFWYEEVPQLYAQQHHMPFDDALRIVRSEYNKVGSHNPNWYRPSFWFERFGLSQDPHQLLRDMAHRIRIFPDTKPALEKLSRIFPLVVLTQSTREFIEIKMKTESIGRYFTFVFSAVDEFNLVKKQPKVYWYLLKIYKLKPHELVHVGDDFEFDYETPRGLGIRAFYLDRKKMRSKSEDIVYDLKEFAERIDKLKKK